MFCKANVRSGLIILSPKCSSLGCSFHRIGLFKTHDAIKQAMDENCSGQGYSDTPRQIKRWSEALFKDSGSPPPDGFGVIRALKAV